VLPSTRSDPLPFLGGALLLGELRPSTLRPPAKVDGCSMIRVLSTIWNRRARGSRLLRSSTGPPSTRALCLNSFFTKERALADWRGRAFCFRTLSPDFDYVKQCPLFGRGPLRSTVLAFSPINFARGNPTAWCGSVVPDWKRRTLVVSRPGHEPVMSFPTLGWVRPQRPETASTIRVRSRN
jgi:hypothetical protein